MSGPRILIVEDSTMVRITVKRTLLSVDFVVEEAKDGQEGLDKAIQSDPPFDLILTDLNMPNMDGFEFIQLASKEWPYIPIIAITGQSSIDRAVKAMRKGACDFIKKPYEIEELKSSIDHNIKYSGLAIKTNITKKNDYDMIGDSAEIHRVFKMIDRLSTVDCSVVITGASGTGKELAARAIHNCGNRKNAPTYFHTINNHQ
ncbi:MAG: sigma-54-dependent Fis family transcriptional regulator [Alcanivoracaceae bacterium]|nr:sigma-54-dependent Fis family transcriptional regulator [Alcanivoracaceae bacterium]